MGRMPKRKSYRSSHRRKRQANIRLARFLRVTLMTVAVCAALVFSYMVLAKIARPYLISYAESREIAEVERRLAEAKAEHESLLNQHRFLQTAKGLEIEARKLGFVKEGEVAVVVGKPEAPAEIPVRILEEETKQNPWGSVRSQFFRILNREDPAEGMN